MNQIQDCPIIKRPVNLLMNFKEQISGKNILPAVFHAVPALTICPTCTCFLLIDKPGFEKVKQMDACQYPGFERVAGGEDALFELHNQIQKQVYVQICMET